MKKNNFRIVSLPKIPDFRGNLSFLEGLHQIPFAIKRAYWIYDVPGGEIRGGHAFKEQEEFIIALSGSFDVIVDSGKRKKRVHLNRSYFGIYIPSGTWRSMENFSTNSLALVLASTHYDEGDYIRNYEEFQHYTAFKQKKCNSPVFEGDVMLPDVGKISGVEACQVLDLDKNHRDKGNITVMENRDILPFDINRVYYLYDVPGGEERGGHAHRELYQLIVAAGGSFDVILDDGAQKRTVTLNRPYQGLLVVPGMWRELVNFSSGSTCLVLASHRYDEKDYIRCYEDFLKYKEV